MTETLKIDLYADNLGKTQAIAAQLAQLVTAGTIMLLDGNLGSGKTTFMQAFGLALGISNTIASPTFTLIDEYTEGRLPLYHIDLYRLESPQIPSLHLEEYWRGIDFPLGVVAIEWASKLPNIPHQHLRINLSVPTQSNTNTFKNPETFNLELDEDDLDDLEDDLPKARHIELTAIGSDHIEILRQFKHR
ncbi:tRNA (adenosine(37)-N6)-threonylcarbamoyltransferase complex ATPase subunit type 1 TsaE [Pseudanabaena sp. UWO310]|uniref:tRNA (adenosine(37)-N6)-threonylcarbamoyltransferase complex ATPase subunit type 1 TsaE n=1 Tax=Pseudanabaena sp. UWO310 TaxID=2480795 RepID=UPI001158B45C|nr:tRNA (adenosine(37)-N6)-threonylcarbamoyltransferase complex ATPase subunit type 1 TsaE [Pseudanabaena sp. UWO310]TYQ31431.1 tRNA (adenosine(37)-N6)-threonylcarbamoyltransferase complex ATPase subunit type 1 TsaE [Pseudanabaena sp. UWO310]